MNVIELAKQAQEGLRLAILFSAELDSRPGLVDEQKGWMQTAVPKEIVEAGGTGCYAYTHRSSGRLVIVLVCGDNTQAAISLHDNPAAPCLTWGGEEAKQVYFALRAATEPSKEQLAAATLSLARKLIDGLPRPPC